MAGQYWTKEEIHAKLKTDDKWLIRGLLAIYARQTDEEQNADVTKESNGIGFNAFDATILSDMAKQYKRTAFLSKRQIAIVRKCMLKYSGQLYRISRGEA
ncbi:hypothetical protein Xoosp13_50 [Xanthomonas phage Xoo-sp13]|nr:hypothetical protein Xoosp13_50 [Xanthomonas phage Xoo-sp13]